MQRQDVVAAVAKAWGEMVGGEGYALGLKTAFAKTGITAPLDGSGDHEIAEEVRAILEDGRGSNWGGKPCSFFEWRKKFMESLEPPTRDRDLRALFESLENPFSRADRDRFFNAFVGEQEAADLSDDPGIVGVANPVGSEGASELNDEDLALVAIVPTTAKDGDARGPESEGLGKSETEHQKSGEGETGEGGERGGENGRTEAGGRGVENQEWEREETGDAKGREGGSETPGDSEDRNRQAALGRPGVAGAWPGEGEDCLSAKVIKEKFGIGRIPKEATASLTIHAPGREEAAKKGMAQLAAAAQSPAANQRSAETEALATLAAAFFTPSIAAGIREIVRKERRAMAAVDQVELDAINRDVARQAETQNVAANNERERKRAEWAAAKEYAAAAQAAAAPKRPPPAGRKEEGSGPPAKRGRRKKYESEEARKAAVALRAKERRAALKKARMEIGAAAGPPGQNEKCQATIPFEGTGFSRPCNPLAPDPFGPVAGCKAHWSRDHE